MSFSLEGSLNLVPVAVGHLVQESHNLLAGYMLDMLDIPQRLEIYRRKEMHTSDVTFDQKTDDSTFTVTNSSSS